MNKDIQIPPFNPTKTYSVADFQQTVDWGISLLGVTELWKKNTGKGAIVFILDTGIDKHHSDLQCNMAGGKNFTDSGDFTNWQDVHGHGTHVAGIVAACNNEWGVVGVAPDAEIFACKVLGDDGSGYSQWIADAINFVVDYPTPKRKIINLSLGANQYSSITHEAIKRANNLDIPVVAAAGNDGDRIGEIAYPARLSEPIGVGSYNELGEVDDFSQRGDGIEVVAPGGHIFSTIPGEGYADYSGTSMATPFVSGVVALMLTANPTYTVEEIKKQLVETAVDLDGKGYDRAEGWGLVNPPKAVTTEEQDKPVTPVEEKYTILEVVRMILTDKSTVCQFRKWELENLANVLELEYDKKLNRRKLRSFIWSYLQT